MPAPQARLGAKWLSPTDIWQECAERQGQYERANGHCRAGALRAPVQMTIEPHPFRVWNWSGTLAVRA